MKNIPLNEMSKFLPYKLQGTSKTDPNELGLYTLKSISVSTNTVSKDEYYWQYQGDQPYRSDPRQDVIPYIRPLSDLTNKISVSDTEFIIPIEWIFHDYRKSLKVNWSLNENGELDDLWLDYPDSTGRDYAQESSFTPQSMEVLFSLKFDVYGWIEKGLAYDINDLKD